jgi:hypothetical protein
MDGLGFVGWVSYSTELYRKDGDSEILRNISQYLSSLLEFAMTQITTVQRSLQLCYLPSGTKTKFDVTYKIFGYVYC